MKYSQVVKHSRAGVRRIVALGLVWDAQNLLLLWIVPE